MAIKLPFGAEGILNFRKHGKRPTDMVIASLVGPLHGESNPVVIAQLGREYDWRFMADLECLVVADSTQPMQAIRKILDDLKKQATTYLGLWFADCQQGMNLIVGGVTAQPNGLMRYMTAEDRQNFAGIGQGKEVQPCA